MTPVDAWTWTEDVYLRADELRSFACERLDHAANGYNRHRQERVLQCSARFPEWLKARAPESILHEL